MRRTIQSTKLTFLVLVMAQAAPSSYAQPAQEPTRPRPNGLIGYNEYRVDLPTGFECDSAMQACVVQADGTSRRLLTPDINDEPDKWTSLAGWSPDGNQAILLVSYENPENAAWEEQHQTYRMTEGWLVDCCLFDLATGRLQNLTAVDRVSIYNTGLFFLGDKENRLGFQAMIGSTSHPFIMDADGRNKKDLLAAGGGFAYGFSGSPDGRRVAFHESYQVFLANPYGADKTHVETGNPFNFVPKWSPDGEWVAFLSGRHPIADLYLCRKDGAGVRKVGDRKGYRGYAHRYEVFHFHNGDSDLFDWSPDGQWLYYTARFGHAVEVMRVRVADGHCDRLTHSDETKFEVHSRRHSDGVTETGIENNYVRVSPDGNWLVFISNRTGTRQLYVMPAEGGDEYPITNVAPGWGTLMPVWKP